MRWRSWTEDHGHISWGLFDGDIEMIRMFQDPTSERWIWHLMDRDNLDNGIEGVEPTVALAAYAAETEMRNPSRPITLANNIPHGA